VSDRRTSTHVRKADTSVRLEFEPIDREIVVYDPATGEVVGRHSARGTLKVQDDGDYASARTTTSSMTASLRART